MRILALIRSQLKRRRSGKDSNALSETKRDGVISEKLTLPSLRKTRSKPSMSRGGPKSPSDGLDMGNLAESLETADYTLNGNFDLDTDSARYQQERAQLLAGERRHAWDATARSRASPTEQRAQEILLRIREHERNDPDLFGDVPGEAMPGEGTHVMGGRFLVNLESITNSKIFKIALQMPKGCHLHLHFNSEILPEYLFPYARRPELQNTMFIRSTKPLLTKKDADTTEIVLNVLPRDTPKANIFSADYNPDWRDKNNSPWMLWADFRKRKSNLIKPKTKSEVQDLDDVEKWAREKMIVTLDNGHTDEQTHNTAWACFNQGTRAFKGLLGYEGIYRWYIGHAIDSMVRDKVMYAELRPMLLDKGIPSDDGLRMLDHRAQMNIIVEEVSKKKAELEAKGQGDKFPFGLRIIYCTPRSIPRERMKGELEDCLKLKLQFPDLICGFDLVGAEDRPNSIRYYADLLLAFAKTCKSLNIDLPFMFHAGESLLDTGGTDDPDNSNLYDALLLHSRRIGHGYALLKHPTLVEKYKKQNVCLELCPISNELLRLCGNAREHPFPSLLAAGLHCTLNADNPSLFSSSLSHEFYQVMVGDPRMSIHGWKQLAEWSIEHSCLTPAELKRGKAIYAEAWERFCEWIVGEFGAEVDGMMDVGD